jgi:predicted phosphohydrolase
LERRKALREEPGHPVQGPDLRGLKAAGVDLLLLAGDIHVGTDGITYADAAARYLGCPAYVCSGNHDGYSSDLLRLIPALREGAVRTGGRVSFLEKDRVDLSVRDRRVAILGATLWTDYRANGDEPLAMIAAGRALNDHRLIRYGGDRFTPAQVRAIHLETREWLGHEAITARNEVDLVVIMTHHGPIPDANPPQYRGGELATAFASDLRQEILDWRPDLWVWGHTHYSMRDRFGRTELVSAQRGYVGSEPGAEEFVPMVVEV